jgi:PAS domain S-box-containing protein
MPDNFTPENHTHLSRAHQSTTEELQQLYDEAPCGYHSLDREGVFQRINQTELNMLGYEWDEIVGKMHFVDLLTPASQAKFHEHFPKFPEQGSVKDLEFEIVCKDGKILPICLSATVVRDDLGNYRSTRSIVIDISDRKQIEQTEARLRYLFAANPAVIYACEATGNYAATFISENVKAMLGYENSEFLADPSFWSHQIHPADRDRIFADLSKLFERGWHVYEYRFRHQNGNYIWVRDELKLIRDTAGEPLEIIGYWSDVTDRKQSEQTMHEQADLLDIAPDAIFVHNLDYQILFWNKGAERLYGWQTAAAIGQDSRQLVDEDSLERFEEVMDVVLTTGTWQGELAKITATGEPITVISRRALLRDPSGNPKSILTVETDITEKKQLESQFFRAQRLESLGTLASGIAHDLNNILTPILGIVEILPLQFPDIDARTQNLLQILEDSTRRGADLVKQILSFTRGVEGKPTYIQIHHLLKEIQRITQQTFPKNIEIVFDYSKHLWTIEADSTLIHQVLMNLCVNSRDAMPSGGTLKVSTENFNIDENYARIHLDAKPGKYIMVSIVDTGIGMDAATIDRIFDPFFTTKDIGKGTGLGLSTAMGIIKSHSGFINVYSEIGKGSCFKVYLPATDANETQSQSAIDLALGNNELILIVDDESSIREITSTTLETYNYRVLTASDGIEAIAKYAEHKQEVDAILLDLMMPSLDTIVTVRTLYKLNPKVKIIAMSGLAANEQMTQNLQANGVKTFLAKPFTAESLLNTLAQVCSS